MHRPASSSGGAARLHEAKQEARTAGLLHSLVADRWPPARIELVHAV